MIQLLKGSLSKLANPGDSLKWRTAQGFVVLLVGVAYQNVLRFAGNLIMARLLYPEAFGLMLIVSAVYTALQMFTDAGIKQSIIVHGHGKGSTYLNTAWTLLCARGAILFVLSCILAWPIAMLYNEPVLFELIIIMSLCSLITGFSSPHEAVYDRGVKKLRITILESAAHTISLVIVICWLLIFPTVWALAGYAVFYSIIFTAYSYRIFDGEKPRFCWDKESVSQIFSFGKWILVSTALTFLGSQGDRLIISGWITIGELGLFSIAVALAKVTETISNAISWKLLLPVYAEMVKNSDSSRFAAQAARVEILLVLICIPFILGFAVFGQEIIAFLYDDRYLNAGWMLQVLSIGTIFSVFNEAYLAVMIAHADSYKASTYQFFRVCLMFLLLMSGAWLFGTVGLIYSMAVAPAMFYLLLMFKIRHYKVDVRVGFISVVLLLGAIVMMWNRNGWPGLE